VHGIVASALVKDVLLSANTVRRLIEPSDVSETVVFLCGPRRGR
jgi:hypothetical protein